MCDKNHFSNNVDEWNLENLWRLIFPADDVKANKTTRNWGICGCIL